MKTANWIVTLYWKPFHAKSYHFCDLTQAVEFIAFASDHKDNLTKITLKRWAQEVEL